MIRRYLQEWIKGSLESSGGFESSAREGSPATEETRNADGSLPAGRGPRERASLSLRQHEKIAAALNRGDGPAAREAMTAHILSSSEDLRSHLSES